MRRAGRPAERGAEALELVACAGLLLAVVGGAERCVAAARLVATAQEDAGLLGRAQAACDGAHPLRLVDVDPAAAARGGRAVTVPVTAGEFREVVIIPADAPLDRLGFTPQASVTMLREPGCEG